MLTCEIIGRIGADAEVKMSNGREFTTFRVAHSDNFKDAQGNIINETTWVDCIASGKMSVNDYLKKGTLVFVSGHASMRVYSSKKDRCMKAGLTINVKAIELLGGKQDLVPNKIFRTDNGKEISVAKYYYAMGFDEGEQVGNIKAVSLSGKEFLITSAGWITPVNNEAEVNNE